MPNFLAGARHPCRVASLPGIMLAVLSASACVAQVSLREGPTYSDMCDASAAAAVGGKGFIIANDEDNVLRVYRRDVGGPATRSYDLTPFIMPDESYPETDIEGAAWLGDNIFWITSHGRNKDGKPRPSRHRLFATSFVRQGGTLRLQGVGKPYTRLLDDLISDRRLKRFKLERASTREPKGRDALNIEGLSATPDGRLLIGFRNPIPDRKALIVPIQNPLRILRGDRAQLGEPIEIDLGGLGVRGMEFHNGLKQYVIIAGPISAGACRLYVWSGNEEDSPRAVPGIDFGDLTPEAFVVYDQDPGYPIQVFSDDGTKKVQGQECKSLSSPLLRTFRSAWIHGLTLRPAP